MPERLISREAAIAISDLSNELGRLLLAEACHSSGESQLVTLSDVTAAFESAVDRLRASRALLQRSEANDTSRRAA